MSDVAVTSSKMRMYIGLATWKVLEMSPGVALEGKVNFFRSY